MMKHFYCFLFAFHLPYLTFTFTPKADTIRMKMLEFSFRHRMKILKYFPPFTRLGIISWKSFLASRNLLRKKSFILHDGNILV